MYNSVDSSLCCVVCRCIHGAALKKMNQGSSTSRICPPPRPLPRQLCRPPPARLAPTSGSCSPASLHLLLPLHPHRHIWATLTLWVRTYCTLYIHICKHLPCITASSVTYLCVCVCLCDLQLHTTQVNAWLTPALLTLSLPVGFSTQLMSWRGSHQGKRHY